MAFDAGRHQPKSTSTSGLGQQIVAWHSRFMPFLRSLLLRYCMGTLPRLNLLATSAMHHYFAKTLRSILLCYLTFGLTQIVVAQCPVPSFQIPSNICAGQPINLSNTSTGGASYNWSFCNSALRTTPLARDMAGIPVITLPGINTAIRVSKTVMDGANYFSYVLGSDSRLYRVIHGQDVRNVIRVESLGNPRNLINAASALDLVKDAGIWYVLVANRVDSKIIRYNLGTDLGVTAAGITADSIMVAPSNINGAGGFQVIKEGGQYFGFLGSGGLNQVMVIQFGTSINTNSATTYIFNGPSGANIGDFSVIKDCNNWFILAANNPGFSNRTILRGNMGGNLSNIVPVWTIAYSVGQAESISGVTTVRESGQIQAFLTLGGGGVLNLNFRGNLLNTPLVRTIGVYPGLLNGRTPTLLKLGTSEWILLCNSSSVNSTRFGRIIFKDSCYASVSGSSLFNPAPFTFNKPGKYYISLDVTNAAGQVRSTIDSVTIRPAYTPDFTTTRPCGALQVGFDEASQICTNSPIISWAWDFGDAIGSSNIKSPTYRYNAPGFYNVTLTLTNSLGMTESRTKRILVEDGTNTAAFIAPTNSCSGAPISFQDASVAGLDSIKQWSWSFGDGGTSNLQNPTHTYTSGGSYTVSLVVTSLSGCTKQTQQQITIRPGIALAFGIDQQCQFRTVSFSNASVPASGVTVSSYTWNFGDGSPLQSGTNVSHAYLRADTFLVTLTAVGSNGCTSVLQKGIRIFPKPSAKFSIPNFNFLGDVTTFRDSSTAPFQTITSYAWNFGEPSSGAQNTSIAINPSHVFQTPGIFEVTLIITTNRGCADTSVRMVEVKEPCPQVSYNITASSSPINTVIPQILSAPSATFFEQDQCAGDLGKTPLAVSQSIINSVIDNTSRIAIARDGNKWYGIGVNQADVTVNNSQVAHLYEFDTSLFNAPTVSNQGILGGQLSRPVDMALQKANGIWYAWILNANGTLVKINLGAQLNPLLSSGSQLITLPTPIRTPIKMRLVQDKDSTFLFALSNDGTNANLTRIAFGPDLTTPIVTVLNNPQVLQSASGLRAIAFERDCNRWYALVAGPAQLFRLNYGYSLNSTPIVDNISSQITSAILPASFISNASEFVIRREGGRIYTFLINTSGNILRWEWPNGLAGTAANVTNVGNLTIMNNTRWFTLVNQQSDWFGFASNFVNSTVYRLKFPNNCSASNPFTTDTVLKQVPMAYSRAGNYLSTVTIADSNGFVTTVVDSVLVTSAPLTDSVACITNTFVVTNAGKQTCRGNLVTLSANFAASQRSYQIDACTGELAAPASTVTPVVFQTIPGTASPRSFDQIFDGTNWVSLMGFNGNISRLVSNANLEATTVTDAVGAALAGQTVTSLRLFRKNGNFYAIGTSNVIGAAQPFSELFVLDFGPTINNPGVLPLYRRYSGAGNMLGARQVEVVEDKGDIFAVVTCANNNRMIIYEFGNSLANFPNQRVLDVIGLSGSTGLSMIKECGTWYALVTQGQPSQAVLASFSKGIRFAPTFRTFVQAPTGTVQYFLAANELVYDAGTYYAFVLGARSSGNTVMLRYNMGSSLRNPRIAPPVDLGSFSSLTTGLTAMSMYKAQNSVWNAIVVADVASTNTVVTRLAFGQPCPVLNPLFSNIRNPALTYDGQGGYSIDLVATDTITGLVSRYTDSVTIRNPVNADFQIAGQQCQGGQVSFIDQTTRNVPTSQLDYKWNFGTTTDPTDVQSTLQNPTFSYATPGVYTIRLRVSESSGCVDEAVRQVRIKAPPVPTMAPPVPACSYDSITLIDNSVIVADTIVGKVWTVADGNGLVVATSTRAEGRFALATAGNYTATLRLRSISGCEAISAPVPLLVNRQGTGFTLKVDTGGFCFGDTTRIRVIPNPGDPAFLFLTWQASNGVIFTTPGSKLDTSFAFQSAGTYTVTVTGENLQRCNSTITRTIPIYIKPNAVLDYTQPCDGSPVTFTTPTLSGDGTIVRRRWFFGDGTVDTVGNNPAPVHTYPRIGTYTVSVRLTANTGCEREVSTTINIGAAPIANFNYVPACVGDFTSFRNQSVANGLPGGIANYLWDFGDGGTSLQADPTHQYLTGGRFNVTLTVVAGNCPNTIQLPVDVPSLPSVTIGLTEGCTGQPYILKDLTPYTGTPARPTRRLWTVAGRTYSDSIISFLPDPGLTNLDATLEVTTQQGCQSSNTINTIVPQNSQANFRFLDSVFTTGQQLSVRFQNQSTNAQSFRWDFGNGDTSAVFGPTYTYTAPGVYRVCLKAYRNAQCSTEVCRTLNVIPNRRPDLAVLSVLTTEQNDQLSITAEVKNLGNVELKQLDLQANLEGTYTIQERWSGSILPGATAQVALRAVAVPSLSIKSKIVCMTALPVAELDANLADNDFCTGTTSQFHILSVRPNPNTGLPVNLRYSVPRSGKLSIQLIDVLGRMAGTVTDQTTAEGVYDLQIDPQAYTKGVYYIRCKFDDQVQQLRLVLQ